MSHDDFKFKHPQEATHSSQQIPTWAMELLHEMVSIRKELYRMRQSTQDLVTAFNGLSEKVDALEAAAAALAAAQTDGSDEAAVTALTKQLLDKTADVVAHTPVVGAVVAPPADPAA